MTWLLSHETKFQTQFWCAFHVQPPASIHTNIPQFIRYIANTHTKKYTRYTFSNWYAYEISLFLIPCFHILKTSFPLLHTHTHKRSVIFIDMHCHQFCLFDILFGVFLVINSFAQCFNGGCFANPQNCQNRIVCRRQSTTIGHWNCYHKIPYQCI